jgi:hypothetical protein
MKIRFGILLVTFAFLSSNSYGCPACVGIVQHDSPPFFSDEFYALQEQHLEYDTLVTGSDF